MKKLALALLILMSMSGCTSNQPASASLIAVSVTPALPPSVDQGQSLSFTASLINDKTNQGVTWSVSGPGCAGSSCGTLSNVTTNSVTYRAPTAVSASLSIILTATSVAEPAQYNQATFFVMPPPSITTTSLPVATPTYLYNATLSATGGVPPLNWSVAGGTLPAGLALNSAGTIYGTPTTGGTSNFTLKVTDSSGAPGGQFSTQQPFSLTVVSILTVPTAPLVDGTVGLPYSAQLSSSGGTPPLTWGVYTGSLPTGLSLQQSTGVIAGTPTTSGTYSFTVEVYDSSPVQQYYVSSTFTIIIKPSGPLTIRTTALVNATVGTAYQGQLVATGGTPPIGWTVSSGTLPPGLALSPTTGALTGTPIGPAGTVSFTVEATDTSTPAETFSQPLSITINATAPTCSSSGNNSLLVGQYAFSLSGYDGVGFLTVVGSFTADGNGDITAGEADTNGVLGAQNGNLITSASSYSVGSDNRGCATLATPFGTFFTRFAVGSVAAGIATAGRIIEFDSPGPSAYVAAGQVLQQSPAVFITPLTNSYALQTSGWDPSTSGRIACVGLLTASKYHFGFEEQDCNDNGTVTSSTNTLTPIPGSTVNTYTIADTNGRATGTMLVDGSFSDLTFYWTSPTELLVLNSDPAPVFSGTWQQEMVPIGSSSFNAGAWNAQVAGYSSGVGLSAAAGDVSIATETADGISSESTQLYRDIAGAWQTPNPDTFTCSYSVVAIGRVTLGGCIPNPPILYLVSLNTAAVLGTDASIELGSFEPQTAGLTGTAVAGAYFVGTSEVVNQAAETEVGVLTLGTSGTVTSTTDTTSTLSQTAGAAGSDTYSLNSNGTLSLGSSGGAVVGIAISGNKLVLVSNPALTFPTLTIGEH